MSDPVGNPEDRFSGVAAHMTLVIELDVKHEINRAVNQQLSRLVGKPTMWFPNRSDTNRPVQLQKQARSLKFWS